MSGIGGDIGPQLGAEPEPPKASTFPDVRFPSIEVHGEIAVNFLLKNPDDAQKAKRAVEAALKLLQDAGGMVEADFKEPV